MRQGIWIFMPFEVGKYFEGGGYQKTEDSLKTQIWIYCMSISIEYVFDASISALHVCERENRIYHILSKK